MHYLLLCRANLGQAFRLSRTTFVKNACIKFEYFSKPVYCHAEPVTATREPIKLNFANKMALRGNMRQLYVKVDNGVMHATGAPVTRIYMYMGWYSRKVTNFSA